MVMRCKYCNKEVFSTTVCEDHIEDAVVFCGELCFQMEAVKL